MVVNTCGYRLQGPSRLQRGLLYMQYLKYMWTRNHHHVSTSAVSSENNSRGSSAVNTYRPFFTVVPEMRHDSSSFYSSRALLRWVRGKHA